MKLTFLIILSFTTLCSDVLSCNQKNKPYLDEALEISKQLPQKDGLNRNWSDTSWIRRKKYSQDGSYRYLIHDIAIEYANAECWENALYAVELIKNLGVKDSALAQIAIVQAQKKQFQAVLKTIRSIHYPEAGKIARYGAAFEFVKHGRLEEGRKVLRGAGWLVGMAKALNDASK